jgi:hypothetical protein
MQAGTCCWSSGAPDSPCDIFTSPRTQVPIYFLVGDDMAVALARDYWANGCGVGIERGQA